MSAHPPAFDTETSELAVFHPAVASWFSQAFHAPTDAQIRAWPEISAGNNTLLLAPTGSGKTLAAFLCAIDQIMFADQGTDAIPLTARAPTSRDSVDAVPKPGVRVLYISPLKALGNDIERNLRTPLAGVRAVAEREGFPFQWPAVGVRSGDTPPDERRRHARQPPDILITTPESLYLILTSRAREILTTVDTVIIDEIHSVARTKRGTHLFVSLERLEQLRVASGHDDRPLQRIGLSATQRPLEEIARLLGGATATADESKVAVPRPVSIVEAGHRKTMQLTVEVPVEDMARLATDPATTDALASGPGIPSIWPAIHPRLVELIRGHRSTMIFVNSRRLAERLAAAINELAGEQLAAAHHGSISKEQRQQIEDRLKRGQLPAIIATSSLELGIDMGAVDLVVQVEAPPSIASGIQRVGRAGHQVDAVSQGVIFPKFRGDLLACSAAVDRMQKGEVESTHYPRNPLDVLAQQLVAMVALEPRNANDLYQVVRQAAPFADLPRSAFDGVLDLLSGRYPSSEFAELRPRVNWDRLSGEVSPRRGTQRLAIANGGTIPDRGLYGVFLADGSTEKTTRVGELDEEMVFETKPGDVFLLGASSWKAVEITHDRVLVVPAPGEPGRMPFWRGDGLGRPLEFGRAIGALCRTLMKMTPEAARTKLTEEHGLERRAAQNLLTYLKEQRDATGEIPSDTTLVVESFLDDVGDWRVAILSPFGARVHAPWATAVAAALRQRTPGEIDMMWNDDGMVFRLPASDQPPSTEAFFPDSQEIEDVIVRELGTTALFAARFRENAARALLLPRRQPGRRTPLWLQRRKSADLLAVAARYERFPIMLETYRECLRDVFDLPGLTSVLRAIENRSICVRAVETKTPSPFAASLLFTYAGNFLYNGDTPLAERRAAALSLDVAQLRELLGDTEMRELLDADVVAEVSRELQRLDARYPPRDADGVHDLLRQLGDLSRAELQKRMGQAASSADRWLDELVTVRRAFPASVSGQPRFIATEDAGVYRDALGIAPPLGLPAAFLEIVAEPWDQLILRFARTHAPFTAEQVADRFGVGIATVKTALQQLTQRGMLLEGEFLPGGTQREWCDKSVLQKIKRRSLARLREQVEPVTAADFARFLTRWQSIDRPRRGLDGLLDVVEQLQGIPLPFSDLERSILPARVEGFQPAQLDELCAAGEIVWRGCQPLGINDGRIMLLLADAVPLLAPPATEVTGELDVAIVKLLSERGATFFDALLADTGGFKRDVLDALWRLLWGGHVTNDTLAPLRSLARAHSTQRSSRQRRAGLRSGFRSRRAARVAGSEGRWSIFAVQPTVTATEQQTALAQQLIERYGIVTREIVRHEGVVGGFVGLYPVLRAMEESGRLRRGYFIAGQGGAQFAAPGAADQIRSDDADADGLQRLAATDPASPYGAAVPWPPTDEASRPRRIAGASVIVRHGKLIGFLSKSADQLLTFLPDDEPQREQASRALVQALTEMATEHEPLYLKTVNNLPVSQSPLAAALVDAGAIPFHDGFMMRASVQPVGVKPHLSTSTLR